MENNIICANQDGFLDFGDYVQTEKQKIDGFELNGDVYKLKSHNLVTKLEKNGSLLFESVPGVRVEKFNENEMFTEFKAYGFDNTQITLELEPENAYRVKINGENVGNTVSTLGGKISFSAELGESGKSFRIERV